MIEVDDFQTPVSMKKSNKLPDPIRSDFYKLLEKEKQEKIKEFFENEDTRYIST